MSETRVTDERWNTVFGNAMLILAMVPEAGDNGTFLCPACKAGWVRWSRARSNGHIHFGCDGCKTRLMQ